MKNSKPGSHTSLALASWVLGAGILLTLGLPALLVQNSDTISFIGKGEVGDVIGGITSPIVGIIGAVLVYFALQAQISANEIIQQQILRQEEENARQKQSDNVKQLYSSFSLNVSNFKYSTLDTLRFGQDKYLEGAEAFYTLFHDINCTAHLDVASLKSNPKITEVASLLKICQTILNMLEASDVDDKIVLKTLAQHQFESIISPRLQDDFDEYLCRYHCDSCGFEHGLPDELSSLIISIRSQLRLNSSIAV